MPNQERHDKILPANHTEFMKFVGKQETMKVSQEQN